MSVVPLLSVSCHQMVTWGFSYNFSQALGAGEQGEDVKWFCPKVKVKKTWQLQHQVPRVKEMVKLEKEAQARLWRDQYLTTRAQGFEE